ncbi:hypothetical protein AABB24_008237, partial [Solanum stoloniferum]
LLPTQPVDFVIEPWWGVCLVNFTLEEFKKLTEEETATIDKICKEEANSFILFNPEIIKGLHLRGLVYFDVPVYPDDRFKVSRLEGFVSNREQSYEDPIEELLYAVFVVSTASFACRLGWAVKLIDPASILQEPNVPGSPKSLLSDEEDGSHASLGSANVSADGSAFQQVEIPWTENNSRSSGYARVAFLVDANITSYLMMGSVSPGLKSHAVTLYEAGKLGHASIADLCKDLGTLEGAKFEGELQEFANHAFSLRCILECLTSGGVPAEEIEKTGIMSSRSEDANSLTKDISFSEKSGDAPKDISELNNECLLNSETPKLPEDEETLSGKKSEETDQSDWELKQEISSETDEKVSADNLDADKEVRKQIKYRVDILRCESLAALSPATLDRLFMRDYDIVVSMVPLPPSSVLPGPKGPVHFGPPSHSSMTPWMKLVLYSATAFGPLSVVLMKGHLLRMLPAPLAGCDKALLWSWDGSSVGGLGGKPEGNLVKGSILLHCINSLLKQSAVLVLPLSRYDLDEAGKTVTLDIPLPLKNSDGSTAQVGEELGLSAKETFNLNSLLASLSNKLNFWTIGFIRLLRLYKDRVQENIAPDDDTYEWVPLSVEFGIPLFSPKLCNRICKRLVSSQLLQTDLFGEHHDAMQELRKKLRDVCAEYQATGPTAKFLYQKEQPKESPRHFMNYASGRWNPNVDPSSPISGVSSEHHRLKLAHRQRSRTEVLSFDGNILRSYALTPVYEAATRPIEESPTVTTAKVEKDDAENKEEIYPGVNLLFDGSELRPFEIGACLQARQPVSLIAEASATSAIFSVQ